MKKLSILILLALSFSISNAQLDRSKAPQAGPATQLELGKFTKFELKNGLKVIVVENHKLPTVSFSLILDLDPIYEGDKAGYTSFAGDLLRAGTTSRSKDAIDEEIDFIGASLSTSNRGIRASALKKHSDELLDLMTDILYNPIFPQDELDKMVKQTLTGIKSQKDDPQAISNNIASALMFGKESPYGEIMSEATIQNITIADCKNFYNTYFRPNVSYLVIVGDMSAKEAKKIAKKNFSQWERKEVPSEKFIQPKGFDEPIYAMGHKDGSSQSYITVSYPIDLKPGTPDALKATVMNKVLGGGGFSARLLKNLREDKAWTYGAYSSIEPDEHMGTFKAFSNVRGTITDSAFVEIHKEMEKIVAEKVNEEDLQLVKNAMAGSFGRALEDPATLARFAVNIDKYQLPEDYYETYPERLEAITINDVKEAAHQYIKPDNALYLAIGDVSVIEPLMKKIAQGKKVTEYDFYAKKVIRTGIPAGLSAEKVIADYVAAIGGTKKVKEINDMVMKASLKIQGMELSLNTFQKAPNKVKIETLMGENVLSKQVYNGQEGMAVMQGQEQKLEGAMLEEMKYEAILFPELKYKELGFQLELSGKDKIDGQDAYKISTTTPSGKTTILYFDVASGLKVKEISSSPMGNSTTTYSNYKEVEGVQFPMSMTQSMGPQQIDITVNSIEINQGIDNSVFE
ncbi:insulinase family protein [Saccharicrinis fermentans]|uniref:Peptidase M16 inactive domain protein n=1 Tax=Saccharicrinis fermentans DSM 9555 = JCM 21142 TaxID=869213 RepID=W7XXZ0_9BACT|nr:insulinase family protein [Saccharicrinis fermentans]GAF03410.1 peptidase M16 inactive domain protein [Saccharicrinis fermentans DSM 9555 = JCM 21142]